MKIINEILSTPILLAMTTLLLLVTGILLIVLKKNKLIFVFGGKEYGIKDLDTKDDISLSRRRPIDGRRLFEYEGYYPIDLEPGTQIPSLNRQTFLKALSYFLNEVDDKMAAMDLIYLREDNKRLIPIRPDFEKTYNKLIKKYQLQDYRENYDSDTKILFENYFQLVKDLGKTLEGVYFEILLHNVRNPLKSIIAEYNSNEVSGRKLYDPSTRFVVQYVQDQGKDLIEGLKEGNKVAYPKKFTKSKNVKATTTPLYHEQLGLIGILCFNIDINKVKKLDSLGLAEFIENYIKTTGTTPKFEMDNAPDD